MRQKNKAKEKIPECCKPHRGIKSGILAGIISHIGCIAIIVFALLGVGFANTFFKKFLFNSYYLYIVFAFSLAIATLAAFFYIKRFEDKRIKSHWKYLAFLYASVIAVNLLMIYIVFPYASNINSGNSEGTLLKLSFDIPCSGHAPFVASELSKIEGVTGARFVSGKTFEVYYNPKKISKEQILAQEICKEFNAREG